MSLPTLACLNQLRFFMGFLTGTIYKVYKKEFKLLHPALQALEDKDYKAYNELMPLAERVKRLREQPESNVTKNAASSKKEPDNDEPKITVAPNSFQQNKRKKESPKDCFNRLKQNNFFCKSFDELLGKNATAA